MRKNLLNLLRLVPIALLLCAGVASAQSTGVITGVVTDGSTGKPVVGAVIVATSPAVQGERTAVTGSDGAFTISSLPAGTYRIAAQLGSYKPAERSDLVVKADTTLRANLAVVPEAVQMEEVVVTGSRVRRLDLTASAPVMVINREQLVDSGKDSVGSFLQTLPQQANGINNQVNNGGDGTFVVDLRGLGPDRTLVLLNGRRMVAGGTGANSNVDLNSIPFAAIDRVEVLADGASAIYGSDAIAGVVNLITRKGYAGTGGTAQYGVSSHGDGQTWDINVNSGVAGDTGSVFFNVGYFWQEPIFQGARDWATTAYNYDYTTPVADGGGPYPLGSSTIPNGRFVLPSAASNQFATDLRTAFPGKTNFIWQPAGTAGTVCTTVGGQQSCWRPYVPAGQVNDTYNYGAVNYLLTPAQRISLFTAP
jgi:iron complex outermembrane receptor protein